MPYFGYQPTKPHPLNPSIPVLPHFRKLINVDYTPITVGCCKLYVHTSEIDRDFLTSDSCGSADMRFAVTQTQYIIVEQRKHETCQVPIDSFSFPHQTVVYKLTCTIVNVRPHKKQTVNTCIMQDPLVHFNHIWLHVYMKGEKECWQPAKSTRSSNTPIETD